MPFAPHHRLTMSGLLMDEAPEAFSMSINLGEQAFNPNGFDQAIFDDLVSDCQSFFSSAGARIGQNTYLREVKLASIGADGKYVGEPRIAAVNTTGSNSTGPQHPPQVACAVSLVTARRGPTGKGRFYLPNVRVTIDPGSGLMSEGDRDSIQAAAATFLNNINNEPGVDTVGVRVVVASSKGYNTNVIGVRVGRALDTIRSRRTSLNESHQEPTEITDTTS